MQQPRRNKNENNRKLRCSGDKENTCQHFEIPREAVGGVIGKKGRKIEEFKEQSGVKRIDIDDTNDPAVVKLNGSRESCETAKRLINDFVMESRPKPELIEIPETLVRYVIGKNGKKINEFKTKSGANICVIRTGLKEGFAEIQVTGSTECREEASWLIHKFVETKLDQTSVENPRWKMSFCLFNHHNYPETTFSLKKLDTDFSIYGDLFQLELEKYNGNDEKKLSEHVLLTVEEKVLKALSQVKVNKSEDIIPDLWCHFGKLFFKKISEEDQGEHFSMEELCERVEIPWKNDLSNDTRSITWEHKFQEGVKRSDLHDDNFSEHFEFQHTRWRYDYQFQIGQEQGIRFKVWEGITEPPKEVKHLICPVQLAESDVDSVAWLCHRAQALVNGDIIVPTSRYDFRVKLRSGTRYKNDITDAQKELAEHLEGRCKLSEHKLSCPEVPKKFLNSFYRKCEERQYTCVEDDEKYIIICMDQQEWTVERGHEKEHSQFGIRVVMESLSEILLSDDWESCQIISKLPKFLRFVGTLQALIFKDIE